MTKARRPDRSWSMLSAIVAVGLLMCLLVGASIHYGNLMSARHAPLVDAAMEIKLEATFAHLWFKDILGGDRHENMDDVWNHLRQAEWYAKAMLEGGRNSEGVFQPLDDPGMRRDIDQLREKIANFQRITAERYDARTEAAAGSDIDQRYDAIFTDFMAQANAVKTGLQELIVRELHDFNNVQHVLMVLIAFATLFAGILLRMEQRRWLLQVADFSRAQTVPHLGTWTYSVEDARLTWSDELYRIFGREPDSVELGYNTLLSWSHPEDRSRLETYFKQLLTLVPDVELSDLQYRLIRPDGGERWVVVTFECEFDRNDRPALFFGTLQDITSRKQAEQALQESEARYRELIDNMSDGVAVYEPVGDGEDFVFNEYNRAAERIGGIPREQVIGRSVRELFPGVEALGLFNVFRRVWHSGDPERHPINQYQDQRLKLWVENYVFKLPSGEIVAIFEDITERRRAEEELARSSAEWTQAMDQFDDAVYLLDMQWHLLRANKAFYDMIDTDPKHCLGRHIGDLIHPTGEKEFCPICRAQDEHQETRITLEPGDVCNPSGRPIEATLKLLRDATGTTTGMLISLRDLSRSREVEERLRLAASVFENTDEGVFITDAKGNIVEVNRAFTEILGYSREEVIGHNPRMWKSGRHDESFYRDMRWSLKETGQWRGELWNRRKNGDLFPEWQSISSVIDDEGNLTHYVGVFSDITQIKHSQEQLDHLAHHDVLTELPNRVLLNERLEHAIKHAERRGSQIAVIFLDIDHFKHINDSLGHPAGDQLLQEVAVNLVRRVREGDTVSRIGGDEFVLLLEDIGKPDNAGVAAEKLMSTFAESFRVENQEIRVTASLGICLYPRDGKEPATLLRNADAAMYRAKAEGRNTYQFYTEALTRIAFERVLLENNLRRAIGREELRLLYQLQVDLQTKQVIGVEALIRWCHPDFGMVPPAKFIPLSEECGLIHSIGDWVLRTACLQGKAWLDRGIDVGRIAVNVAAPQIQRGRLPDEVSTVLAETGFPASRLELEVTEGFVMQQPEFAIGQLNELRLLGVTLAIDDFGTGYSSLSYLKKLPINKLKIDQSFVRDIPEDPNDMAIADAIIAMGKSLGLTVIAEGVETENQATFLQQAGCQKAQGYLYSRPVSPEDLEKLACELND